MSWILWSAGKDLICYQADFTLSSRPTSAKPVYGIAVEWLGAIAGAQPSKNRT